MKFSVSYENQELNIQSDGPVSVLELLRYLKRELKVGDDQILRLHNNKKYIGNDIILKDDEELRNSNYSLVALDNYDLKKVSEPVDILELISQTTNASKKMEIETSKSKLPDLLPVKIDLSNLINMLNTGQISSDMPPELASELLNMLSSSGLNLERQNLNDSQSGNSVVTLAQPIPELVNQLKEMGFEEARCRKVLIHTHNEINAATELLLTDQDLDLPDCNILK